MSIKMIIINLMCVFCGSLTLRIVYIINDGTGSSASQKIPSKINKITKMKIQKV